MNYIPDGPLFWEMLILSERFLLKTNMIGWVGSTHLKHLWLAVLIVCSAMCVWLIRPLLPPCWPGAELRSHLINIAWTKEQEQNWALDQENRLTIKNIR